MTPTSNYRPIEPDDCAALSKLHLSTCGAKDIAASIFLAPRVSHYLAELVAFPRLQNENWLWGAWDGDPVRGVISYQTAISQALLGHRVGETVSLQADQGTSDFEIASIEAAPVDVVFSSAAADEDIPLAVHAQ